MKELLCHYCERVVARIQSGSSIQRGVVLVCKRCAEIEGIVGTDWSNGGSAGSEEVERLEKIFGMKR